MYISLTPNHFLHGQMGGQFAPEATDEIGFELRDMSATSTRISKTFLASMIQRMDSKF